MSTPSHYNFKTQPFDYAIDITKELSSVDSICVFNIIKYISRYPQKGGLEDLKKAKWYLDRLIATKET